jgi:hypothetical protein
MAIAAVATLAGLVSAKGGAAPAPAPAPAAAPAARPADLRKAAIVPATCTADGIGEIGFNKSGSRVTLSVGVTGGVDSPGWTVTVTDSVAGVVAISEVGPTGAAWTAMVNYDSPKGNRSVDVLFEATDGSNSCAGTLQYTV